MALATYSDLQASIASFTHRADLTAVIPDFIRLAEDIIYGDIDARLQDVLVNIPTVANVEFVSLPGDFINLRSVTLNLTATSVVALKYLAPVEFRKEYSVKTFGSPVAYTIVGPLLYMQPMPDSIYQIELIYELRIPALSVTNTTNNILTLYPSIYLYASLVQAAIFVEDTEKEAVWRDMYKKSIEGINANEWNVATPLLVRTDVNLTNLRN